MSCEHCANWVLERRRRYCGDGTEQTYFTAPEGKGQCDYLKVDTPPLFHCAAFSEGCDHVKIDLLEGAPWQHFVMGACPDCNGTGGGGICLRCAGTSKVRFYADGHIGEERTRRHPKEPVPDANVQPVLTKIPVDVLGVST